MPTAKQINEKVAELRDIRIANDNDCMVDALSGSLSEVRALINAKGIDDKLAALDAFKSQLFTSVEDCANLWQEAQDKLRGFQESPTKMFERENAAMFAVTDENRTIIRM